ncbi:MAG TPA: TetR family transcriptional regulator [Ktedonobacteraceae bacterium]|jgi:AcrR family transcriptional regulator
MPEPESRRGRVHDAEGAREAILNAAEVVFAEHGFDGARIDAIAAAAGYNKSLIFHYFDDKLGLYAAVIRRADKDVDALWEQLGTSIRMNETTFDSHEFRALLKATIGTFFDYTLEHPRFVRILLWEMAEGWQTYTKVVSQKDRDDIDQIGPFLHKLQCEGLLRSTISPSVQFVTAIFSCFHYLSLLPLCQVLLPGEDLSSTAALARAKEYATEFVIHGMLVDSTEHV